MATTSHTVPVPGSAVTRAARTSPAHVGHFRSRNARIVEVKTKLPTIQLAPTAIVQNSSRSEMVRDAQVPKGPRYASSPTVTRNQEDMQADRLRARPLANRELHAIRHPRRFSVLCEIAIAGRAHGNQESAVPRTVRRRAALPRPRIAAQWRFRHDSPTSRHDHVPGIVAAKAGTNFR